MRRFEDLGRSVAKAQDAEREARRDPDRASVSYVRALRQARFRRRPSLLMAAMVLGIAATALVFWLRLSPAPQLVAGTTPGVPVGRLIRAPEDRPIPLTFSDGSQLVLAPGTQASVKSVVSNGATVDIEAGRATVSVVHRANARWLLEAGPYRVRVTGTKFTLDWVPASQRFELHLEVGSVVVTSDASSHAALTMNAPERLVVEHGDWQLSPGASQEPAEAASANPSETVPSTERRPPDTVTTSPSTARSPTSTAPVPARAWVEWQRLGKEGQFAEAYRAAAEIGIPVLGDSESASSLLTLAEVCRFAGHSSEAMVVLTKLRQRFGGTTEAAIAAFQLGRLSSNGQLAASWFRAYLKEKPGGNLSREAAGRLLEALARAGSHAEAKAAARDYLERYPSGPHAEFARRLTAP